jgi:hypothetical protein
MVDTHPFDGLSAAPAPVACNPDLWMTPGEAAMQTHCEIEVPHHLSLFEFSLGILLMTVDLIKQSLHCN